MRSSCHIWGKYEDERGETEEGPRRGEGFIVKMGDSHFGLRKASIVQTQVKGIEYSRNWGGRIIESQPQKRARKKEKDEGEKRFFSGKA